MVPPDKIQIPGFTDSDSHEDVITKGFKGLGIATPPKQCSLLVSSSLVKNSVLPSGKV